MSSFTRGAWWPTGETSDCHNAQIAVTTGFSFKIGSLGSPWSIDIEEGFVCDLWSGPWWCRWAFAVGKVEIPGAVHDKCRSLAWMPLWMGNLIFLHAMWVYGTPKHQAIVACIATFMNKRRD